MSWVRGAERRGTEGLEGKSCGEVAVWEETGGC